jgi:pimeloyl-ACP methyl ester carboxylesterase
MRRAVLTTATGITEYEQRDGKHTPVLFIPGHTDSFSGNKATHIKAICERQDRGLICPAHYGWEQSTHPQVPKEGRGYIRHWLSQLLDITDALCQRPHILIGHSMGGILMLQLARRRPQVVAGLIGIAAGFGIRGQADATAIYGNCDFVGLKGHTPLTFTARDNEMIFAPGCMDIHAPIRLQHGLADEVISFHNASNIATACTTPDVQIWLNKSGNHSLNDAASLHWLEATLLQLDNS